MRNVISIDSRYDCVCNAVVSTDTKTDEIVLEVITGDSANPFVKLIVNDESHYIKLKANQSNYVNITSESWTLGESIQFQYVNNEYEGTLFTLNFPAIVKDITVSQTGETEFTVKSLINSTRALMVEDIVNDLTSTDIYKVLGADQGKVLDGKISGVNELITNLTTIITELNNNLGATLDTAGDANDIKKTCILRTNSASTNVKDNNGLFIALFVQKGQCGIQINTSFNSSNNIYFRTYWYGTWYQWKKNVNEYDITALNTYVNNIYSTTRVTMGLTASYMSYTCPSDGLIWCASLSDITTVMVNNVPALQLLNTFAQSYKVQKGDVVKTVQAGLQGGGYFYPKQ